MLLNKLFCTKRTTVGEQVFKAFAYIFLVLLAICFILPILTIIASSFVSAEEYIERGAFIIIPHKFDFTAYEMLLSKSDMVITAYSITIFKVVVGTILSVILTAITAYALSKDTLPLMSTISLLMFFTMIFNGGLIPSYLVVTGLGLKNSIWSLILPGIISTWYVFIMRNFFKQIPNSIEEAAKIDGAGTIRTMVEIIFPLSLPAFATISLFYAVAQWNSWFDAALYIDDAAKMPVQNLLRNIVVSSTSAVDITAFGDIETLPPARSMRSAMIVIGTLPIIVIYPFLQKYFIGGMTVGAVKG